MKKFLVSILIISSHILPKHTYAKDITGTWKNIDDKTGSSK